MTSFGKMSSFFARKGLPLSQPNLVSRHTRMLLSSISGRAGFPLRYNNPYLRRVLQNKIIAPTFMSVI
jgi:hypothetical protein